MEAHTHCNFTPISSRLKDVGACASLRAVHRGEIGAQIYQGLSRVTRMQFVRKLMLLLHFFCVIDHLINSSRAATNKLVTKDSLLYFID